MSGDEAKRRILRSKRRCPEAPKPAGMQAIDAALWARIQTAVRVLDAQQQQAR